MTCSDGQRKRRQRAAYDEYARLQWQFYRLPRDHPARAALAEVVRAAEERWRALMQPLEACGGAQPAPIMPSGRPMLGPEEAASVH